MYTFLVEIIFNTIINIETINPCEKEVRELKRKQENLNPYLGRTQPDPAQEQQEKSKNQTL